MLREFLATVIMYGCLVSQTYNPYMMHKKKSPAVSGGGGGGITVVQHKSSNCLTGGTTCSLAFSTNIASSNTLVYLCADNTSSQAMTAATDSNSNTILNSNSNTTAGGATRIDYVSSANGGATTVTCNNPSTSGRIHIHIWEISGLSSKVFDKGNTGSQTSTSLSISTSAATTAANEIVFGFFYDEPNNDSLTAGTGFSPSEFTQGAGGEESSLSEIKIVSSTGVQTATATCGVGTSAILENIATFK